MGPPGQRDYKVVTDTIHGTIRLDGLALALSETPEVQRLSAIHQTGLSYLVFPGANHTRLEHSLGAAHIAGEMALTLGLPQSQRALVVAATLLHDIGHGAFSHTLEYLVSSGGGSANHMEDTQRIIEGTLDPLPPGHEPPAGCPRLPEVLQRHGQDPHDVAALVSGELLHEVATLEDFQSSRTVGASTDTSDDRPDLGLRLLAHLVHSPIDADQLDYLLRDSHYTGVAHGVIDKERLVQTLLAVGDRVVVHRNGLSAVEGMITARALMYSSVYFHKTVRIAEVMLARATEALPSLPPVNRMVDADLWQLLLSTPGRSRELALDLRYRRLYKRVLSAGRQDLGAEQLTRLNVLADPRRRRALEEELTDRAGVGPGLAFIDTPFLEGVVETPRTQQVQVGIYEPADGSVVPLARLSSIARALSQREVPDWLVTVSAHPAALDRVRAVAPKVLWG